MSEGIQDIPALSNPGPLDAMETSTSVPEAELPYGLNIEDCWYFMDDWEISEDEKIDWLIALAHMVKGFVDLGMGQDSVQRLLAQKFVDKFERESRQDSADSGNMLDHKDTE